MDGSDAKTEGRRSVSFLVRLWIEPGREGESAIRGYLRDLQSGAQQYVGNPEELGTLLLAQVRTRLREVEADEGDRSVEAG